MWVKLDDNFPDHPKVDALSEGAFRLYIASLCHAQKYLTDGMITFDRPARLMPRFKPKYIDELLDVGLWEPNHRGYLIHDFTIWNKTREHWLTKRAADALRLAEWRAARAAEQDQEGSS
jgi:hypothetical protein